MGEMIQFKRPDGRAGSGYLAVPSHGEAAPGVVVVLGVATAVWGVVTASVPLIGAGAAALVAAFGLVPRHRSTGR